MMPAEVVRIPQDGGTVVEGELAAPDSATGLVLFAHGSGSSRHSTRNRMVAARLQDCGLGTLLMDLLTTEEEAIDERTRHLRFDIGLLADRLVGAASWVARQPSICELSIGYFGASTGAAAALVAAARQPARVGAVVCRGGRPDLAGDDLGDVCAPTLLIVGALDRAVVAMNEDAYGEMRVERRLEVIPGATHLFEEPGALEEVARLAADWFTRHLTRDAAASSGRELT